MMFEVDAANEFFVAAQAGRLGAFRVEPFGDFLIDELGQGGRVNLFAVGQALCDGEVLRLAGVIAFLGGLVLGASWAWASSNPWPGNRKRSRRKSASPSARPEPRIGAFVAASAGS